MRPCPGGGQHECRGAAAEPVRPGAVVVRSRNLAPSSITFSDAYMLFLSPTGGHHGVGDPTTGAVCICEPDLPIMAAGVASHSPERTALLQTSLCSQRGTGGSRTRSESTASSIGRPNASRGVIADNCTDETARVARGRRGHRERAGMIRYIGGKGTHSRHGSDGAAQPKWETPLVVVDADPKRPPIC